MSHVSAEAPRTFVVVGSARRASYSAATARSVVQALRSSGADIRVWNLAEHELPFHDPEEHQDLLNSRSPAVRRFASSAEWADAFVWLTPIYHNSLSGVLKNALDNLNMDQVAHKPVLLVTNGGRRSFGAAEHLKGVALGLKAVPIPRSVATLEEDFGEVDGQLALTNPELLERLQRAARELVAYARAHAAIRPTLVSGAL